MQMRMELTFRMRQFNSVSDSLLKASDEYYTQTKSCRKKLPRIASRAIDRRGYPLFDFLLYELFPELRPQVRAFHAGNGPHMDEVNTPEEIRAYDLALLAVLKGIAALPVSKGPPEWEMVLECARTFHPGITDSW